MKWNYKGKRPNGWTCFRCWACALCDHPWQLKQVVPCLPPLKYVYFISAASLHRWSSLSEGKWNEGTTRKRPAVYSRTRWVQQRTMVAQSMGFPSCFIFSIRAFICSRLMSFGCSIKRKNVGRWLVCPLPFTLSESTLCLSCEVAAQGEAPCSSLPVSGVSAGCPPCSPPEKHKSDYRLVFPRWCQKPWSSCIHQILRRWYANP